MPDSLDHQNQQPSVDPRNTPERLRSVTAIMLAFAIVNSINLISGLIPFLPYVLFPASFVLAIILLIQAPKNYKANWAAWLEIAAEILFVGSIIALNIGAKNIGLSAQTVTSLTVKMSTGSLPADPALMAMLQRAAFPSSIMTFISFGVRVASVVFGYISYSALKKARNAAN